MLTKIEINSIFASARLRLFLAWYLLFCFIYLTLGFSNKADVLTASAIDDKIVFWPPAILIYASHFAIVAVTAWVILDKKKWLFWYVSIVLASLSAFVVFAIWPTTIQRDQTLSLLIGSRWLSLYEWLYRFDPAANCSPSLHVALSTICAFSIWSEKRKLMGSIWLIWSLGIATSTLLTKQHYAIDVVYGWLLALFALLVTPLILAVNKDAAYNF